MINIERLKHQRDRIQARIDQMEQVQGYSAETHTYHGGWSMGYEQGKRSVLEEIIDMLEEGTDKYTRQTIQNFLNCVIFETQGEGGDCCKLEGLLDLYMESND